jgi:chaperonin GroES
MVQEIAKKVSIRPLGNRVLVQRLEEKETTKGSIILPDSAKQKQEKVRVIAVGPGAKTKEGKELPMPVSVGNVVLLDKYSGQEVTLEDEEYLIVRADEIIAIVN